MSEFLAALPQRLRGAFPEEAERGIGAERRMGLARWQELALVGFAYLLVGLLVRGGTLGFPVIHIDEQFYLLVGDRMLHGAVPFVDIWDRKPVGLFILFAAMRLLGGEGILQYQLVALACVAGTSLVIYRIAREIAPRAGAWWAGVAYQLYLSAFFCFGGQAPVYYNLLIALCALAMVRVWTAPNDRRLFLHGAAIMLVIGVAMQLKYTVLFEGMAFGFALMARARKAGWHTARIAPAAAGWAMTALVPTLAAWGWYVTHGYNDEFIQANFLSIFGRHEDFGGSMFRLFKETMALLPVWVALFWAPRHLPKLAGHAACTQSFLRYWAGAATLGFLIFGTWYDHYVAPLLVPLMIASAPALGQARPLRWITRFMIGLGIVAAAVVTIYNTRHHGTTEQVEAAAATIRAAAVTPQGTGCAYINEGDPILYLMTNTCFVTRYVFPNHLNGMVDVNALGVNAAQEVAHIMATRPQVVVMTVQPSSLPVNWQTRNMIFNELHRDYQLQALLPVGWRGLLIYKLKPATAAPQPEPTPSLLVQNKGKGDGNIALR
ncbi:hypothetical protein EOE18_15595 [Novosphingobium umbonatum]|uniref:Glycosyltransferase RgtA/B/C/D-like domain-containing protein n=1 Tax=Novosphingobium umbonatum TaxID=1908524 RepID=A0A437N0V0_9SPHN|nr:glycosyltransferase family 39 protein [Novosphingobium umbonatum]RVU03540.1 hypothetical protein EOE18_15595 [Novosphingobium umbonatum]